MAQTLAAVTDISARGYARPEVLVSTQWVEEHRSDPKVRLVESNEDVLLYETGHIPGAVKIDWVTDLNDPLVRDYVSPERFERLLRAKGIDNDTTIVFYGDKNNWWATYAFWVFRLFGVENLKILDGGRLRWADEGRELVTTAANYPEGHIKVRERDDSKRALRGGHIPGAKSIPWGRAITTETHTFRPAEELRTLYQAENGLGASDDVVVYCRIGERSSHTWFALTYLLGFENVRNYDGSWTEWGNTVRAPIEKP